MEAMANLTRGDVFELNLMIVGSEFSQMAEVTGMKTHLLAIGFAHVDARTDAAMSPAAKAEVYLWLERVVMGEIGED